MNLTIHVVIIVSDKNSHAVLSLADTCVRFTILSIVQPVIIDNT